MEDRRKTLINRFLRCGGVLVFLLLMLVPARYLNTIYGYIPFLFVFFVLIISNLGMLVLRKSIVVESDFNDAECERGTPVRVSLKIRNKSIFVCPKARAVIYISDIFGSSDDETVMDFTMAARAVNDFSFDMDMTHIGSYHVGVKSLAVYDMTGIFRLNVPVEGTFRVNVNPRVRDLSEMEISDDVMAESENDTKKSIVGGMNYTGVREYEFGDSMKQIHWKLSAHSPTYMTKINESNRQSDYVVIIDFAAPDYETEELMDVNDCLIETAVSALDMLAVEDVSYSLIFIDRSRDMQRVVPAGRDYDGLVRDFGVITPDPDPGYPDGTKLLIDEGAMLNRSANVILCTSRATDALIQELINVRQQKRFPELFYVIPERFNSREREKLEAPLEELSNAGITYHVVSTEVNRTAVDLEDGGDTADSRKEAM